MSKSLSSPVRRGQLISPFGVGAMVVVPGGTSLIIGGLDTWFEPKDQNRKIDINEFKIFEWRLQRMLGIDHLRLPPDYRDAYWNQGVVNMGITIPAFRFPTWHFCSRCHLLMDFPMYASGKRGKLKCPKCEKDKKTRYLSQVRFVAMCENGHIQDFPWREWVHSQNDPDCQDELRLISTGSASLAGQRIVCGCGKQRNLQGITTAYPNGTTFLSKHLSENDGPFQCQGKKPWLGQNATESCNAPLRGSLRGASNLYFAQVESSLYIPISEDSNLQELENIFQNHPVSTFLSTMKDLGISSIEQISQGLRSNYPRLLMDYSDGQLHSTLHNVLDQKNSIAHADAKEEQSTSFRQAEYSVLRMERDDEFLKIKKSNLDEYCNNLKDYFSRIMLVSKMCETRVLAGFTRVFAENDQSRDFRQTLLWKELPSSDRWLPAYRVFGEGLFFEFSEDRLMQWEMRKDILKRIIPLELRSAEALKRRHLKEKQISARFVLLHTFSHLLMNRLTFECGYSSAALRERLYVSATPKSQMHGVLIYTADGDSEGTMGGLVRMGKPGNLENIVLRAIENAKWCSADPVCMELGSSSGQGPDSCNLAACHNCALVPETACEEFNHYLDRGVVVGDFEQTAVGYFDF